MCIWRKQYLAPGTGETNFLQIVPSCRVSGAHRAPHVLTVLRESINATAEQVCAAHQPRSPLRCNQRQKMSEVTVQHTLAERSSQAHVGGLIARTVTNEQ